jgi:hypothetical protein
MTSLPADNAPSLKTDTRSFKAVAPNAGSIPGLKTGSRGQVPIPTGAEYITARQYCGRLGGISFTTLARMNKRDPEMPRAIYFANRIRFFKVSDILAYEHLCEVRSAAKLMAARAD